MYRSWARRVRAQYTFRYELAVVKVGWQPWLAYETTDRVGDRWQHVPIIPKRQHPIQTIARCNALPPLPSLSVVLEGCESNLRV